MTWEWVSPSLLITVGTTIFTGGVIYAKLVQNSKDVQELRKGHTEQERTLNDHEKRISLAENNIKNMDGWLGKIEKRVDEILRILREKSK